MKPKIPLFFKILAAAGLVTGSLVLFKGFAMLAAAGDEQTASHSPPQLVKPAEPAKPVEAVAGPLRLTGEHLALIRYLRVVWAPTGSGVPGIDPNKPLLGEGPPLSIAMRVIGVTDEAVVVRRLSELSLLIDVFVREGVLARGSYEILDQMRQGFDYPGSGVSSAGRFYVRKEHLTLLKAARWRVMDSALLDDAIAQRKWVLPRIDDQKPYGDHSRYVVDMAQLLGDPYKRGPGGELIADPEKDARLEKLHRETAAALQVYFHHATMAGL